MNIFLADFYIDRTSLLELNQIVDLDDYVSIAESFEKVRLQFSIDEHNVITLITIDGKSIVRNRDLSLVNGYIDQEELIRTNAEKALK